MLLALKSAELKLREYYSRTIDPALGNIYAHGTILAPQYKLQFFLSEEWQDDNIDYAEMYRSSLQDQIRSYQQDDPILSPQARRYTAIELAVQSIMPAKRGKISMQEDELKDYLQSGKLSIPGHMPGHMPGHKPSSRGGPRRVKARTSCLRGCSWRTYA